MFVCEKGSEGLRNATNSLGLIGLYLIGPK